MSARKKMNAERMAAYRLKPRKEKRCSRCRCRTPDWVGVQTYETDYIAIKHKWLYYCMHCFKIIEGYS